MKILFKFFIVLVALHFNTNLLGQLKSFKISPNKDTINKVDKKNYKQGKWVLRTEELRGEPGFEEEGVYKDDMKEGIWRRYTLIGDPIGFETYLHGGKDGPQQYYSPLGDLLREENWRGYNPDSPYDTIPIYGTGSGEIIDYKIVKAQQYSVKHGIWKYYEPGSGRLIKTEEWDRNVIKLPDAPKPTASTGKSLPGVKKVVAKTPEMLLWEKKNKGKKKVIRDGSTTL
jgi:antitoxin component YwqK of YwqJK toxin-antitoxin module